MSTNRLYKFDVFELDASRRALLRQDEPVALTSKAFDLLFYLVANPGRVVTKEELLKAVWPDSYVEESNLAQHVSALRRALEAKSSLIVTVPGRGYQFTGLVKVVEAEAAQLPAGIPVDVLPEAQPGDVYVQHVRERTRIVYEDAPPAQLAPGVTALLTAGEPSRYKRVWRRGATPALAGALMATTALAIFLWMRLQDAPPLRISSYMQITHDGNTKFIGGTDGSRIYYTEDEPRSIDEVSISGGAVAPLSALQPNPWAGDVSPDGSTLLIVSQAGGVGPADSLWTFRILGGTLRRIANAIVATWSPDGESIAYATSGGDIYQCHSDGSEARKLISVGGNIKSIAWSPDGRLIRFSKNGLLWEMDAKGANLRQLLPGWSNSSTQWSGEWDSDGQYYFVSDGQIWSLNERSVWGKHTPAAPVQLTFGPTVWDRPLPSRGGKKIFALGRAKRGELVRLDPKTGQFHTFLDGISAEFLTYSSDAKSIAYVTFPEGVLWRANADGSHPTQLTFPPVYPKSIRWSPDGAQILFVDRSPQGRDAIYIIPADGSGKPRRLLPEDHEAETDPCWSPDGRKIVFSTSPNVGASAKSDLRTLDIATGNVAVLPASDGLLVPHWSPDGLSIAAMTLDTMAMKVFHIASGQWTKLETGAVAFPEWSRDGRFIYYVKWTGDPAVTRIRVSDGKRETVADMKGARYTGFYTLWMGLDPADTPMLLRDIGSEDIFALTLERK